MNWSKLDVVSKIYFLCSNFSMLLIDLSNFMRVNLGNGCIYFTTKFSQSDPIAWTFIFIPQAWTLGLEIYFYLLVPFLVKFRTKYLLVVVTLSLAIRFLLWNMMYRNDPWTYRFFPSELMFFVIGGICFRMYKRFATVDSPRLQWQSIVASVSIIFISVLLTRFTMDKTLSELIFFTVLFVCLPFSFHCSHKNKFDKSIGELSYPVYIVHTLVINVVRSSGPYLWDRSLGGATSVLLSVLLSIILIRYIQSPVEVFRRAIADGTATSFLVQKMSIAMSRTLRLFETAASPLFNAKVVGGGVCIIVLVSLIQVLPDKLYPPVYFDIFNDQAHLNTKYVGFGPIEHDERKQVSFRWGEGPVGTIVFDSPPDKKMRLLMEYGSPLDDQVVSIRLNGSVIAESGRVSSALSESNSTIKVDFSCGEGINILEVCYSQWNGLQEYFARNEPRKLAVAIHKLRLESAYR